MKNKREGLRAVIRWLAAATLLTACVAGEEGSEGVDTSTAPVTAGSAAEKDLAIVFSLDNSKPVRATELNKAGERFLPGAWYQAVLSGYASTPVGDAIQVEDRESDWSVVSARIVPCSAFGVRPRPENDALCWPELRVVWQPVVPNVVVGGINSPRYGDDRAIHALYDVRPDVALGATDAARASGYLNRLKAGGTLTAAEQTDFTALRDQVAKRYLADTLALRGGATASAYQGHGVRPEMSSKSEALAFTDRFRQLLGTYARPQGIKVLTSFSLPEGREPALFDDWTFLAFRGQSGAIVPDNIRVQSAMDGRVLVNLGPSQRGFMNRDDDRFYDEASFSAADLAEIKASVALYATDPQRLLPSLRDRRILMVPNTSCASCHKLNALRFDFHNLSYLEDRAVTVSPRVVTDVALDLAWIKAHLGS